MILGLDVSTSITGATLLDEHGNVLLNFAIDTRKYKNFFEKAECVEKALREMKKVPHRIFIEQSLQSFRSGFSSAKTLSTLSRFNGVVSWICYRTFDIEPEYIAATSARKSVGIKVPKGVKAKQQVIKYVVDNVPDVSIEYTKHGNPRPQCFDKADSWVIARAGWNECQEKVR
jgi:glycerol kinase